MLVAATAGIGYATADHAPLIDNQELALDIEVKVPAKGRSIEQLKEQDFSVALLADRDARYADMRWSDTVNNGDTIVDEGMGAAPVAFRRPETQRRHRERKSAALHRHANRVAEEDRPGVVGMGAAANDI